MTKLRVAFIGQCEYFRCHYESDLDKIYDVFEKHVLWDASAAYYQDLIDFRADINIFFRGELVPVSVLEALKGFRVSFSTEPFPKEMPGGDLEYTLDSLARFQRFVKIRDYPFDAVLHYDAVSESFLRSQGVRLSGYEALPIAAQDDHAAFDAPKRDIVFLGRSTPHRDTMLGLLKRDFDVFHIAHGWPPLGRERGKTSDFSHLLSGFHIALNLHAEPELSWEPRIQLMMAYGALVVSEPISPNPIIRPGIHFLEANGSRELYELCTKILAEPRHFSGIREAGRAAVYRSLAAGTWWPRFIKAALGGQYSKPTYEPVRLRLEILEICKRYNGFEHLLDSLKSAHG